MILLVIIMTFLVFAAIAFVLCLWFFTGQHIYPESSAEYPGDELEEVCEQSLYHIYEEEEDPETVSKREIEARNNILKLENLL